MLKKEISQEFAIIFGKINKGFSGSKKKVTKNRLTYFMDVPFLIIS
jgi:hypothetical protein